MAKITLTSKDFKIDWFSGTGAGGQHRNKHQNCCRITHIETGITETGQNHRERSRNKKEAYMKMAQRLAIHYHVKQAREINEEVIRTYNEPDNRVKDHLTGMEIQYSELDKKFDELITMRLVTKND